MSKIEQLKSGLRGVLTELGRLEENLRKESTHNANISIAFNRVMDAESEVDRALQILNRATEAKPVVCRGCGETVGVGNLDVKVVCPCGR